MQDVALLHQAQTKKHLLSIDADGANVDTNITSKFLQNLPKIDAEILEDHTQMSFVLEVSLKSNHMFLILWICFIDLL